MTEEAKKIVENLSRCYINDRDAVIDAIDLIENLSKELEKYKKTNDDCQKIEFSKHFPMTLNDVCNTSEPVLILEMKGDKFLQPVFIDSIFPYVLCLKSMIQSRYDGEMPGFSKFDYGRKWRLWNVNPTWQDRTNAKWSDIDDK